MGEIQHSELAASAAASYYCRPNSYSSQEAFYRVFKDMLNMRREAPSGSFKAAAEFIKFRTIGATSREAAPLSQTFLLGAAPLSRRRRPFLPSFVHRLAGPAAF